MTVIVGIVATIITVVFMMLACYRLALVLMLTLDQAWLLAKNNRPLLSQCNGGIQVHSNYLVVNDDISCLQSGENKKNKKRNTRCRFFRLSFVWWSFNISSHAEFLPFGIELYSVNKTSTNHLQQLRPISPRFMNLDVAVIKDRSECRGLLFLERSQMEVRPE